MSPSTPHSQPSSPISPPPTSKPSTPSPSTRLPDPTSTSATPPQHRLCSPLNTGPEVPVPGAPATGPGWHLTRFGSGLCSQTAQTRPETCSLPGLLPPPSSAAPGLTLSELLSHLPAPHTCSPTSWPGPPPPLTCAPPSLLLSLPPSHPSAQRPDGTKNTR